MMVNEDSDSECMQYVLDVCPLPLEVLPPSSFQGTVGKDECLWMFLQSCNNASSLRVKMPRTSLCAVLTPCLFMAQLILTGCDMYWIVAEITTALYSLPLTYHCSEATSAGKAISDQSTDQFVQRTLRCQLNTAPFAKSIWLMQWPIFFI